MAGCSAKSGPQPEKEINSLKAEMEQAQTILAEKNKLIAAMESRKELTKEFVDLYNRPINQGEDQATDQSNGVNLPAGDQSYAFNLSSDLDGTYSVQESLERVEQVRGFLKSFVDLTEKSRRYLSQPELDKIGNTSWEIQALGFANIPLTIEGALRDQNYIIKKLDLGLAIKRFELGEIELKELQEKAEAFQKAKGEYENFIQNAYYAD